jgi:Protein of unknown function (DUF3592)
MTIDPVLTWSFLGVGVFGLGFALMLARRPLRMLRSGGKAQGTVTGNDEQVVTSGRGSPRRYFMPKISYTTAKGERVSFTSASGSGVPKPAGTVVSLIYDPANPRDAFINSFASLWLFPVATGLFSLPFFAVGLLGVFS